MALTPNTKFINKLYAQKSLDNHHSIERNTFITKIINRNKTIPNPLHHDATTKTNKIHINNVEKHTYTININELTYHKKS